MLLRSGRTLEEAGRSTVPRRRRRARSDLLAGIPEEILQEILVRLPPKSVLRCRAVCRSWRRLASDHAFLLDHHLHQPELPLVSSYGGRFFPCVRAFDPPQIRAVFGSPSFTVDASCDGLVISGQDICNPTTRQHAPLSPNPKHRIENLLGLFRHPPSGEYRVLYWRYPNDPYNMDCLIEYRVLTVGTDDNPRIVDCSVTPVDTELISRGGPKVFGATVLVGASLHLHWRKTFGGPRYHRILVFDTVAESFRQMRPPRVNPRHVMHLFDMGGTLAASTSKDGMTGMSIFRLQDRVHDVWAFQYRIQLPVMDIRRYQEQGDWWAKVVTKEGDVLVSCYGHLLRCDTRGNLVGISKFDDDLPVVLPLRLKESLIQHAFFQNAGN